MAEKATHSVIESKSPGRLLSLDAFRGFTIALMILVNNPGSWDHVYPPLLHAKWNGLTPTDLVFPFFLFIVGVSIVLAYSKRLALGADKSDLVKKIIFRSLKIFAVGIFLNLCPDFDFTNLRIAGVLQRIAIVFLICSFLYLNFDWKSLAKIGAAILVLYWIVMALVPVPGLGVPSLEPGNNIAAWIDSILLPGRKYQVTWDPEGLLSTLPAIGTGIAGMLAGVMIVSKLQIEKKVIWLFTLGFIALLIGIMWDWTFPINKNLWTSSFVLYTAGAASMTLAALIFFVDMLHINKWVKPGLIFGANAIAVYVLAGLIPDLFHRIKIGGYSLAGWIMETQSAIGIPPKLASLIYAICFLGICYLFALLLYRKKIFIKL
jgi:predicted acyltransferase